MSKEKQYLVGATADRDYLVDSDNGYYGDQEQTVEVIIESTPEAALKAAARFAEEHEYFSNARDKCQVTFSPMYEIQEVGKVEGVSLYEARKLEAERRQAERIKEQLLQEARWAASQKQRELAELERLQRKYNR